MRRGLKMKKFFETPMVSVIILHDTDILTASNEEEGNLTPEI